jgi:hypothetical protein
VHHRTNRPLAFDVTSIDAFAQTFHMRAAKVESPLPFRPRDVTPTDNFLAIFLIFTRARNGGEIAALTRQ